MPEDVEANGTEVSDPMSENENEYDDTEHTHNPDDDDKMAEQGGNENTGEVKKKYDPKDPLRPRRKKARRACYACQRAHLTCGDERPCQRCIKRGLADACQDGVRKKAKYLHDAPPEALRPVLGPNYNPHPVPKQSNGRHHSTASDTSSYFAQNSTSPGFQMFPNQPHVANLPFAGAGQQSPISPDFQQQNSAGTPVGNLGLSQVSGDVANYANALFDPSNPAIFNFDLEGLNFGSQYGALEFGMLGRMASGAADTPPRDRSMSQTQGDMNFSGTNAAFGNNSGQFSQMYDSLPIGSDFLNMDPNSNGMYAQGNLQHGLPHAYAIAASGPTPTSLASPGTENTSSPQPTNFGFESSPTAQSHAAATSHNQPVRPKPKVPTSKLFPQSVLGKRPRDSTAIYESVKEPYSYLNGFHSLLAFLHRRFSYANMMRIAKSLASIRPAFMSCTRTLDRRDLIFMEKCLQRTLFEYEDFMTNCSAPTIVLRRTGEVCAVNKEFVALTQWSKNILLGKEANLNVNYGQTSSTAPSSLGNSGHAGMTTPKLKGMRPDAVNLTDNQSQPVFIAELMDDDSVIEFYEDFAHLAFGDSRGSVTRKCKLLKYRSKDTSHEGPNQGSPHKERSILSNRVTRIDGEHGISKLEKDGKLDCTYTWTIKRDVFDIPMLIVMNFLPCYYRTQDHVAV